jgi:hypothetical protein
MRIARRVAPWLFLLSLAAASAAQGTLPWVGRSEEMEAHLRNADIVKLENIGVGVTQPRRAYLRPDVPFASFAWKPLRPGFHQGHYESYKSEIAAYEFDKLLGMNMVPPIIEREIDGEKGAAVMWIDGTVSVKERGGVVPTGPAFSKPIRIMQLFDNLIGNPDRNAGNILIDASNNLILIDHSRAFVGGRRLPSKFERVDATIWTRVQALTRPQINGALSPWLDDAKLDAILARRDALTTRIDDMIRKRGKVAVVIP